MAGGKLKQVLFAFLALTLFATSATAGLESVKNIAFSVPGTWYYLNGNFELNAMGTAEIQTYSSSEYNYEVDNMVLTMSPMALISDVSSSGQAIANFQGGGTLTFSGDLRASGSTTVLYSGTILEADMTLTAGQSWQLKELNAFASLVSISGGSMGLSAVEADVSGPDDGLYGGITAGSDTLVVGDMSLAMQFVTGGISNFSSNRMGMSPAIQIAAAEVPEPATLILLAAGGLGVLRRRTS